MSIIGDLQFSKKNLLRITLWSILVSCGVTKVEQEAYDPCTHKGSRPRTIDEEKTYPFQLSKDNPDLKFAIDGSLSDYKTYLIKVAAYWDNVENSFLNLIEVEPSEGPLILFRLLPSDDKSGISNADRQFDSQCVPTFCFTNLEIPPEAYFDRYFIPLALHEFGHCLGLKHSKDSSSVMAGEGYSTGPTSPPYLGSDDKEQLSMLYPK